MSLRDTIDKANDLPLIPVEVKEWGCTVYIKTLRGSERLAIERDFAKDAKVDGPAMCRLVVATLADEQGNLVYTYPDDIPLLNAKSVKVLNKLFDIACAANGMTKADVEELVKN